MNTLKKYFEQIVRLAFIFFLWILWPLGAQAKFMVEPHWDRVQGTVNNYQGNNVNYTGDMNGLNLGYLGQNVMAGLVVSLGRLHFEETPTKERESFYRAGGVGTYLGFHLWGHLKFWTEYQNSTLEPSSNEDVRYFGQKVTFGLGFRVYDGVLINYKYYNNYYTQSEDDDTGKTSSLPRNLRDYGQSIGLSFIFVF